MMKSMNKSLGQAQIGPSSWRNESLKNIKLSQSTIYRSHRACEVGRSVDPLPHLRDVVAELSNAEAHRYFRQIRSVVCMLRSCLIDTNEEIKSLTRGKETIEKSLEHIRKDIKLNEESQAIRLSRPQREKDNDGADDLLSAERMHLLNLKRQLESQLQLVQQQLQVLDSARRRLAGVISERSRTLDLISHALPGGSVSGSAMSARGRQGNMSRSGSRLSVCLDGDMDNLQVDPIGPYTPEVDQALIEASDARSRSAQLRSSSQDAIARVAQIQKQASKSVNDGLLQKIAETVSIKQQLDVAKGQNAHSANRAQRWYDQTEKAWGYSRGPVTSADLSSRERLDRPVIRVFQRHPGTNLPEAQEIVRGGNGLLQSLQSTGQDIGLLRLTQLRLQDDIRDKSAAAQIDGGIVRMRRKKANHRWAMGAAF